MSRAKSDAKVKFLANRMTRRNFAPAFAALGAACLSASVVGAKLTAVSARAQYFQFENRSDLENTARALRREFPGVVLLDAMIAPHVPGLIAIVTNEQSPRALPDFLGAIHADAVYEVRRFPRGSNDSGAFGDTAPRALLIAADDAGSVCIYGFQSLAERTSAWDSAPKLSSKREPNEVGFYRLFRD